MNSNRNFRDKTRKDVYEPSRTTNSSDRRYRDFVSGYNPISHNDAQKYANDIQFHFANIESSKRIEQAFDVIQHEKNFLLKHGNIRGKHQEIYNILDRLQDAILYESQQDIADIVSSVRIASRTSQLVRESLDSILREMTNTSGRLLQRSNDQLSHDPEHNIRSTHRRETEQTDSREQGSWENLLGKENWERVKKIWFGGNEQWSEHKAVIKILDNTNKNECQEMQNLKVPGYYVENNITKEYMYIPIKKNNAWEKAGKAYGYDEENLKLFVQQLSKGRSYDNWKIVKHLEKPDVKVQTPNGSDYSVSPSKGKNFFDTHLSERSDITMTLPTFQNLIGGLTREAGGLTRISSLLSDERILDEQASRQIDKKLVIDTPIVWKNLQQD